MSDCININEHLPAINCPRCGYDQRGTAATWAQRGECDVLGVCAECGLAFEWADVLAPQRRPPEWCFEHCPRKRFVRAAASTVGRSLLPWRLWKRIRMEHRVRPARLAAYALVAFFVPLILLYVAVQTTAAVYVRYQTEVAYAQVAQSMARQLAAMQTQAASDPQRAEELQDAIARLQFVLTTPTVINHGYFSAVLEAVLFPGRRTSTGSFSNASGVWPYHAPRGLHRLADLYITDNMPPGARYPRWVRMQEARGPFLMLAVGAAVLFLVPLSLALLPISRRRARVRWSHVARVAAYSAPIPVFIAFIALLLMAVALVWPAWSGQLIGAGMFIAYFAMPVVAFLWWWMAITHYMRMPRGWLIALILTATCTLATGTVVLHIDNSFLLALFR